LLILFFFFFFLNHSSGSIADRAATLYLAEGVARPDEEHREPRPGMPGAR